MLEHAQVQVAEAARRLAAAGLVSGTSGNLSAREGDHIAVSPTGAVLADLQPEQVTVIDLDGAVVGDGLAPTSEVDLHLEVYRRYGAGAVVHTHAPMATALSTVLDEVPVVHYEMLLLGGPVRVAPYRTFGTRELAEDVADALDGRTAALMANHGTVTWGGDMAGALRATEVLEWACTVYWRAAQLGTPRTLSEDELRAVGESIAARNYGTVRPA
jgi:L-fuculose-phosphate aldolase